MLIPFISSPETILLANMSASIINADDMMSMIVVAAGGSSSSSRALVLTLFST